MIPATEMAWAGGLFDGEGSIQENGRLKLAMTDRDSVERFARAVQIGTVKERKRGGSGPRARLTMWEWGVASFHDRMRVMHMLLPWLSERRRNKWFGHTLPVQMNITSSWKRWPL